MEKETEKPNLDAILDSIPEDFQYPNDIVEFIDSEPVGNELL